MSSRIELQHDQFKAFLKDDVIPALEETASARISSADGNFRQDLIQMPTRVIMRISCADAKTERDNLENNVLLKVIK